VTKNPLVRVAPKLAVTARPGQVLDHRLTDTAALDRHIVNRFLRFHRSFCGSLDHIGRDGRGQPGSPQPLARGWALADGRQRDAEAIAQTWLAGLDSQNSPRPAIAKIAQRIAGPA